MSIAIPALELKSDVDLFALTERIADVLSEPVSRRNCSVILKDLIESYDKNFCKGKKGSFRKAYIEFRTSKISSNMIVVNPKFDFVRIKGRVFMISTAGLSSAWRKLLLADEYILGTVLGDYSFYNASDEQVSSGELTYEEWRERSDFWNRNISAVSRVSLLSFHVLMDYQLIPSNDMFQEFLDSDPSAQMDTRREKVAKDMVLNESLKSVDMSDSTARFFEVLNNTVMNGYPGWEDFLESVPELPELSI